MVAFHRIPLFYGAQLRRARSDQEESKDNDKQGRMIGDRNGGYKVGDAHLLRG